MSGDTELANLSAAELREFYDTERELADRLRAAPSKDARRRLYAEVYRERSERLPSHPLVQQAADPGARAGAIRPQAKLLEPFLGPSTVFCEIGAGDGAVARSVATAVRRAIAFDVTDALALPDDPTAGFEFRVFDGFDLGLVDEVDVAYSNDVAEHLHPEDMHDHALAVHRALVSGGVYVCVTPNRLSGPHDISGRFSDTPRGFHLREYTTTELAGALRAAGFRHTRVTMTVGGRRLVPPVPSGILRPVESALERLPHPRRRRVARPLAAFKLVAEK